MPSCSGTTSTETATPRALETLLAYNTVDVIDLETLMVMAYNMKVKETPFAEGLQLPMPGLPDNPFEADAETLFNGCERVAVEKTAPGKMKAPLIQTLK